MKTFSKIFLSFIVCIFSISLYAAQDQIKSPEKTFILRVTSKNPGNETKFDLQLILLNSLGTTTTTPCSTPKMTPFQLTEKGRFIEFMLSNGSVNPEIKVELLEKNEHDV